MDEIKNIDEILDEKTQEIEEVRPEDKNPFKEKLAYGAGALMDGGGVALMSCVLLRYMTGSLGIAVAAAGAIMMVSKIWDAITDPLMGTISDNTRSKWGRRKPYMFFGGIFLFFAFVLIFMPINRFIPNAPGKVAYMVIMYILYNTASTITQVPYCSMASDISRSFKERNNANTVKLVFSAVAAGIAYLFPLLAIESLEKGKINDITFWLIMFLVFGGLFGGGLMITGAFVKERVTVPADAPKQKFDLKQYLLPLQNKSFRWHIVMYASAFMCMDIISALAVYYTTDVWRGVTLFGMKFSSLFVVAPLMVTAVIAFPVARIMMDKKSKQFAFRMGLPAYILGGVLLAVMDPAWTPPILIPIAAAIMGFGFGGAQMMPWIIYPDTVDVAELKLGYKPAGAYSGTMTLVRKVAGAFGVAMVSWILEAAGYLPAIVDEAGVATNQIQSEGVLLAIRLSMGISIVVLISVALFASFMYKVDNNKLMRIRRLVDLEKEVGLEGMSEEDKQEKFELTDLLVGYTRKERIEAEQTLLGVEASAEADVYK